MPAMFRYSNKPSRKQVQREHDGRRGSARARGYSAKWDRAAKAFRLSNPVCVGCAAVGRTTASQLVDHIEPHRGNEQLFWDMSNWQALCRWHHDAIKARLEYQFDADEITALDLKLSSKVAIELTRLHDPSIGGGG